jgi:hypothetical protein
MKTMKIEQIRAMAGGNDCPPLTPAEKQWVQKNVSNVFKSSQGLPVVICGYFEPDYKHKLAMAAKIGEKMPLHIIDVKHDHNL